MNIIDKVFHDIEELNSSIDQLESVKEDQILIFIDQYLSKFQTDFLKTLNLVKKRLFDAFENKKLKFEDVKKIQKIIFSEIMEANGYVRYENSLHRSSYVKQSLIKNGTIISSNMIVFRDYVHEDLGYDFQTLKTWYECNNKVELKHES